MFNVKVCFSDKSKFLGTSNRTLAYCPPLSSYLKTVLEVLIPTLKWFEKALFITDAS